LPGFCFETSVPLLAEALPRMDIAVFVGFAASGPLHTPVVIEGPDHFAEVFGADAPLAWDSQRCRQVYAHLGPAVRSFFRNGGRRCWAIRVASDAAAYNYFPIPGLAMAVFDGDGQLALVGPALARARSEGSWSDSLRTSSALLTQPIEVISMVRAPVELGGVVKDSLVIELRAAAGDVVEGDLLRLSFKDATAAVIVVESVSEALDSPPSDRGHLRIAGARELWLQPLPRQSDSPETAASARVYNRVIVQPTGGDETLPGFESENIEARIDWPDDSRDKLEISLLDSTENVPAPGSLIQLSAGKRTVLMRVADSGSENISGLRRAARLRGDGLLVSAEKRALPAELPIAEKLSFEMWVRGGNDEATRMTELGFNAPHPRFWGDLSSDRQFYSLQIYGQQGEAFEPGRVALAFDKQRPDLGRESRVSNFPLAGAGPRTAIYFPVNMSALPLQYLGRLRTEELPPERDGLGDFNAGLFLDPELVETGTTSFSEQADFLRYLSPQPRHLRGVHAAFGIEEATIIAVPDAIHRGWSRAKPLPEPVPEPSKPIERPEWWHFRDCKSEEKVPLATAPERGHFLDCDADAPPPPSLRPPQAPDPGGSFTLSWSSSSPPSESRFILEQSSRPNFSDAAVIYEGGEESFVILGRAPGEYYYRIRVERVRKTSDWSNGVGVRVSALGGYQLTAIKDYSSRSLLAVQRALLRMCAARGDLFAVLSLPEHYREDDAESYVKTLKSPAGAKIDVDGRFRFEFQGKGYSRNVPAPSRPLGGGEAAVFSHGAIYHPWLIGGEQRNRFSACPPDGDATGVIAARSLGRGAWIAPANEALRGPVALTPAIGSDRWLDLQEARINIVRQDARGFMAMSADTLSEDDDLRPINVRRLLSLLRRLALRLGTRYVFEPNDDSFRRMVQRGFEAMLGEMFARGAFAGATPQTSFQVVTGDPPNTLQSVDQGRFIVELRVAPSLPMTFMAIRLVHTGDRSFVVETR
jgi:hypothetical protein